MMKICKRCGETNEVEEHHIHCKFMDNPKGFGLTIDLCKKCHTILGLIIPSIVWKYIQQKDKLQVIKEIESFTKYFCKKDELTEEQMEFLASEEYLLSKTCGNMGCHRELDKEDYIDGYCPFCNNTIKNGDIYDKYN